MLTWNPAYEIGVPAIDAQHRTLFERAGMFAAAVRAGEPYDRLEDLFTYLTRYAVEHFAAEERLMQDLGYPDFAEHAAQHVAFQNRLLSLIPQWDSEGASRAMLLAMLGFLHTWLDDHITRSDQRIGEFVRR
ncbi:MAG TPA: bacteriohemerythrin [Anaeromyxobacteraceae bacterium]|nr:bacteriohemerythrin [Anaeromyxobacteraceae bacterium]